MRAPRLLEAERLVLLFCYFWGFLVAQMVKNLPEMQETQVQSLGQETKNSRGQIPHYSFH